MLKNMYEIAIDILVPLERVFILHYIDVSTYVDGFKRFLGLY